MIKEIQQKHELVIEKVDQSVKLTESRLMLLNQKCIENDDTIENLKVTHKKHMKEDELDFEALEYKIKKAEKAGDQLQIERHEMREVDKKLNEE